jgi:hypothetical protein
MEQLDGLVICQSKTCLRAVYRPGELQLCGAYFNFVTERWVVFGLAAATREYASRGEATEAFLGLCQRQRQKYK